MGYPPQESPEQQTKKGRSPCLFEIPGNAACVLSTASAAFPGHLHFLFFFFLFLLLGFCRFLLRGAFLFHHPLFLHGRDFLVSAHGTAFVAASAAPPGLIGSPGGIDADHPGPGQQAGNAEPCQKLFQILCLHDILLAIVSLLVKRGNRHVPAPFLEQPSMDQSDAVIRISSENPWQKSTKKASWLQWLAELQIDNNGQVIAGNL